MVTIPPTHLQPTHSSETSLSSTQTALGLFGLSFIILLGAFLRFYQLGANNVGNTYYAATVQSMLLSWHNFFFVAFEPGGSVTVDKPPLGFWIQAVSAYFLGVNGFALALPQALAGVLSLPLLYIMVKRSWGTGAGLVAALVLATAPVTVSTERNNTIDGTLLFVLLLAAWAFLQAVYSGQVRYLYGGAFLVGLGFNIKMMQAFLPLPAFYGLYLLGAPLPWKNRLSHLLGSLLLLISVSLSWAIIVDLTPPDYRPYVGSSSNNTVMQLIVGHNGLNRLFGHGGPPPNGKPPQPGFNPPPPPNPQPPQPGFGPPPPQGGPMNEIGFPSPWRLFFGPLAPEAGWLLPYALLGLGVLIAHLSRPFSFSNEVELGLILWGGWFITEVIFFSTAAFFHAYYLIMLGPPLAALMGAVWALFNRLHPLWPVGITGITVLYQSAILWRQGHQFIWLMPLMIITFMVGVALVFNRTLRLNGFYPVAQAVVMGSLLIAPFSWSMATAFNTQPDVMLPHPGPNHGPPRPDGRAELAPWQKTILDYLVNHHTNQYYLAAAPSAQDVSGYILATKQPMLTFGGFSGNDNVVTVNQLAQFVQQQRLRYILSSPQLAHQKADLEHWIKQNCTLINLPGMPQVDSSPPPPNQPPGSPPPPPRPSPATLLYDCQP